MDVKDNRLAEAFEEAMAFHERDLLLDAERGYLAILRAHPDHSDCLHQLGALYARQGRLDEALALLQRAAAGDPASAEMHNDTGSVLSALRCNDEAIASFDRAIAIDPAYAEAHHNRGGALQALGHFEDAVAAYCIALSLDPDMPTLRFNLGTALQALDRHKEAIDHFRKALALTPDHARTHAALGVALHAIGQYDSAIPHYETALAFEPDSPDGHNNLGLALQALNRYGAAITHHEKALALRPGFAGAHNNIGLAFQALNRHDEAIAQFRQATAIAPPRAVRYANLGMALQEAGCLDEACLAFERAIDLAPRTARFYRNLADCKRFTAGDPRLAEMEELARDKSSLPHQDQRQLLFALGKAFADIGEYDRSFGYMLEGNSIKRQQITYDEPEVLEEFARIQTVFSRELIKQRRGAGSASHTPVFILGMPRSGTTLVEQVLASHSKVHGAGERPDFGRAVHGLDKPAGVIGTTFPEVFLSVSNAGLRKLGERYLAAVLSTSPAAERVTDKMPLNFFFAGLIHLALPNARIIHTIRDPIDTCLSCFMTLFTGEHRVAYELGELGRYYRAYEGLMEHWRRVLPRDVMLEVRYEDVVADFEQQARRIVSYCGLEWEDACLSFHTARHPVRTASAAQVRQPIYRSSVGRWRPYRHLLRPLFDALGVDATGGQENSKLYK